MDAVDRRFASDVALILVILFFAVFLYAYFSVSGILLAGALALTVLVIATVLWSRSTK